MLRRIAERITGRGSFYKSPTDMGVNRAGFAIVDDGAVLEAAKQEVLRRCFRYRCEYTTGFTDRETVQRVELLAEERDLTPECRAVIPQARQAAIDAERQEGKGNNGVYCGAALELRDGTIVTGCNSPLMHAASSLILHAAKHLAEIPARIQLLPPSITPSLSHLKKEILGEVSVSLDLEESLVALGISATTNPAAELAVEALKGLRGCEVHMTHIPTPGDEAGLRRLGVNVTSDPSFATRNLFVP